MDEATTLLEIVKIGGPVLATVFVEELFRWRERLAHREAVKEINETMRQLSATCAEERSQWSSDVREVFERISALHAQALDTIKSNTEVLSEFLTVIKERLPRGNQN